MNGRRKRRRIAKLAKYTVPVSGSSEAGAKRLTKRGSLKDKYRVVGGSNEMSSSNRIPYETVAKAPKLKRRRRVFGGERKGKGTTIYK